MTENDSSSSTSKTQLSILKRRQQMKAELSTRFRDWHRGRRLRQRISLSVIGLVVVSGVWWGMTISSGKAKHEIDVAKRDPMPSLESTASAAEHEMNLERLAENSKQQFGFEFETLDDDQLLALANQAGYPGALGILGDEKIWISAPASSSNH
ncbi:MAG: hypothetical protein R3C03_01055 [Pirellulaceae bacterium]